MEDAWLRCEVHKGMFSDERAIVWRWQGGREESDWVPANKVRGEDGTIGAVRVKVYEVDGVLWAMLPTDYSDSIIPDPADVERELVEA